MEYLLAWRMALAKNLLRNKEGNVAEVAERVGTGRRARSVWLCRDGGVPRREPAVPPLSAAIGAFTTP